MVKTEGSITIFMTFLFLLMLSLVGVSLDSARFFGSRGYVEAAGLGAHMASFGDYNKELFQEYGLLAYGGYDGLAKESWLLEYQEIFLENLRTLPPKKEGWQGIFQKKYTNVYHIHNPVASLSEVSYLAKEDNFLGQIDTWMKATTLTDISELLIGKVTGNQKENPRNILEELQEKQEPEINEEKTSDNTENSQESIGDEVTSQEGNGENPITFFQELMTHGILRLVCSEEELSEKIIARRNSVKETSDNLKETEWCRQEDGVAMLEGMLSQSDSIWDEEMNKGVKEKGKLLLYASQVFSNYLENGEKHASYGLEYLISGKEKEDDTMAYIVNRLFLMRMLMNYAYVNQNPIFIEKSLVTATEIAVPICAEPFIPLIQQCILLILATEEACVDVTALLQGRLVPFAKTATCFQMQYEEMCLASEGLFQKKATAYKKSTKNQQLMGLQKGWGYLHYLWLMLLMTSWDDLYNRTLDLIQDDLRSRYNESFDISQCICGVEVKLTYEIPILSSVLLKAQIKSFKEEKANRKGFWQQSATIPYKYH